MSDAYRYKVPSPNDLDPSRRMRNESEQIVCILNPRAKAGEGGRLVRRVEEAMGRCFATGEIWHTEGPGHASELAARAVEAGADIVAAVGGDGTCNEVVNGLFDGDRCRDGKVVLSLIPVGTGSDLSRSLLAPSNLQEAFWIAATGMTLRADVGHLVFGPSQRQRVFLNVAGFGANGEVVKRANASSKRLGGRATFLKATLGALGSYEPPELRVRWEDAEGVEGSWQGKLMSAFVANGAWCGGGMHVGRGGSLLDGLFDLTLLPPLPPHRLAAHGWRLYEGSLWRVPGVVRVKAARVHAEVVSGVAPLLDVDGEQPGELPATLRCLRRALQVRGGWLRSPLLEDDEAPAWRPGAVRR